MATYASIERRFSKLAGLAIGLLVTTALVHFVLLPEAMGENSVRGVLFLFNGAAGLVAASGIYYGAKWWGWGLGLLVAAGALVMYVVSRAFGIPWMEELGEWLEPIGVLSLVVEAGYVLLWLWAFLNPDGLEE